MEFYKGFLVSTEYPSDGCIDRRTLFVWCKEDYWKAEIYEKNYHSGAVALGDTKQITIEKVIASYFEYSELRHE